MDPSEVAVSKETCPECNKKNSLVVYADGHKTCFTKGCGHREGEQPRPPSQEPIPRGLLKPDAGSWQMVRRVTPDTLRKYGSFLGGVQGGRELITPVYDNTGLMVAQHVRLQDGTTKVIGAHGSGRQLGGQNVFGTRLNQKVVLHSDALDAMSTAQVTHFRNLASVFTYGSGLEAVREVKDNYRWLDGFGEIVLFLKATPQWQEIGQQIAALFGAGKVKIANLGEGLEGPNAALQAGKPGDIESAVWAATPWRPVGIVNAREGRAELFKEGLQVASWPYPWPEFNERLMGIRPGECTYHIGGTGIAKTTLLFHYAVHLLKWDGGEFIKGFPHQEPCKIGWLGFEDMTKQVKVGMLGIHGGRMLQLEPIKEKEGLALFDDLFGSGRLELYDPEQAEYGLEAVFSYAKYMVRALDCRIIVFDPLTFIVSQLPAANRVQEEERLASRLAAEAKAMAISFQIGYHLKKPDGTPFESGRRVGLNDIKGSGALSHYAHNVLAYRRNQQGDRPDLLAVDSLKNRYARYTGEVCVLKYDMATGRYKPTSEPFPEEGDTEGGQASRPKKKNGGFDQTDY